jgi:hypothetical protein
VRRSFMTNDQHHLHEDAAWCTLLKHWFISKIPWE